jgi:peptide/nickel transport system substrate-binding protein
LPYTLPNTKVKPFDDARVRRAMRLLFDHEEFRNSWCVTWHGREGRYGSIIPNALDAWDLTEEEYKNHVFWRTPKDAAAREAISLLNAAGITRENPLRFEITGMSPGSFLEAMTVMLQSQWRRLSQGIVDPQVRVHETPISFQLRANREFAYFSGGTDATTTEVDAWLSEVYRTGASQNYGDFSDPRLDDMIDRQRALFDVPQRKAAVRDLILYALDQVPTVTTANRFFLVAVRPRIRGYAPEFNLMGRQYENVWLDA